MENGKALAVMKESNLRVRRYKMNTIDCLVKKLARETQYSNEEIQALEQLYAQHGIQYLINLLKVLTSLIN